MNIFAKHIRLATGWGKDTRLYIDGGLISKIEKNTTPQSDDTRVDTLLPALSNLHSHSFQRAMAGMTEYRERGQDSFWTWRDLMYRFTSQLSPEHISAFASQTFMEMQLAGYASVGEFHYVHHQENGTPYDAPAELSLRIMEAAATAGIGLTHLPVLYSYGGAGGQPLADGQRRFGNNLDNYAKILADCRAAAKHHAHDTEIGIAPHSLRATLPEELLAALQLAGSGPIHIHIAEQTQEVDDIKAQLGARPVEWLLDNAPVDDRWCLIHATHMTDDETRRVAQSKAIAGLCPVTEANLGDGIFNGSAFLGYGGMFGVGSDSNINISLTEELRMFEYSQRLRDRQRNVLVTEGGHTGERLYLSAATGGAKALSRNAGKITPGVLADVVAIDRSHPRLCGLKDEQLLDGLVFAANDSVMTDLWSAGRHQVRSGRHVQQDKIEAAYRTAMDSLGQRLN